MSGTLLENKNLFEIAGHNSDVQMNKKKVMIKIPWNHVFSNNDRKNKVADIFCCRKAGEKKRNVSFDP